MTENGIVLPTDGQIRAANDLHDLLPNWDRYDCILEELRERDQDFSDFYETLLKTLAVHQFYWAGCSDIPGMVTHIRNIRETLQAFINQYEAHKDGNKCIEIVEVIALRGKSNNKGFDGNVVFASKFAHFFLEPKAFPIFDKHAEKMVQHHLGLRELGDKPTVNNGQRYKDFFGQFYQFKERTIALYGDKEPVNVNKKLDQYLWLLGICEELTINPDAKVNGSVKKKYKSIDPTMKDLFRRVFPYILEDNKWIRVETE